MKGKMSTTSSKLFVNNNEVKTPEWMEKIAEVEIIKKEPQFELEPTSRGIFAESLQSIYRPDVIGDPRKVEQNYDVNKLTIEGKIALAKFLIGRRYAIKNVATGSNVVAFTVQIDGVPAQMNFTYQVSDNRVVSASTFTLDNGNEYPFSKAGFDESLMDIKTGKVKESRTVEAVSRKFLITKEQIVRRCGTLREATNIIQKLLGEGLIKGAGSNVFASTYDIDYLIPQMEKEAGEATLPAFEHVPNQEHVAAVPNKSAKILAIEADKFMSDLFPSYEIKMFSRDDRELLVKANILNPSTNIRTVVDFSFDIENEKVSRIKCAEVSDKRMSVEQLFDYLGLKSIPEAVQRYIKAKTASSVKFTSKIVFTKKDLQSKLRNIVSSASINKIVQSWLDNGVVDPINSTTFASDLTFEELLTKGDIEVLPEEQVKIAQALEKFFGENYNIDTTFKPTGDARNEVVQTFSENQLYNIAQSHLNKFIKAFDTVNFEQNNNGYNLEIRFANPETGIRHNAKFSFGFDNGAVTKCAAIVGSDEIPVENLLNAFKHTKDSVKRYLDVRPGTRVASNIIITLPEIERRLSNITSVNNIPSIISAWKEAKVVHELTRNTFASNLTFEELLEASNVQVLSSAEINEQNEIKRTFGKGLEVNTTEDKPEDRIRQMMSALSDDELVLSAVREINKMFKDYAIDGYSKTDDLFIVTANVMNPVTGLKKKLGFGFEYGDKLNNLIAVYDGQLSVTPNEINKVLASNDTTLNTYLANNQVSNRTVDGILINKSTLESKLASVATNEKISELVSDWINDGTLKAVNSNSFVSKLTVAELVSNVSTKLASDLENVKEKREMQAQKMNAVDTDEKKIMGADSRYIEPKEQKLSPDMRKVADNLANKIKTAYHSKKITYKTASALIDNLNIAKSEKDLESISKTLGTFLK